MTAAAVLAPAPSLSLPPLGKVVILLAFYLFLTRIGHLQAAKIGIEIGPLPIFLTDAVLLLGLLMLLYDAPERLATWGVTGQGAGLTGLLCYVYLWQATLRLPFLGSLDILKIKDFAIFGYTLLFPVAYFSLRGPAQIRFLLHTSIVGCCILAVLLFLAMATGYGDWLFGSVGVVVGSEQVERYGGGDVGGTLAIGLSFVATWITLHGGAVQRRWFAAAALLLLALLVNQTRSALVGFVVSYGIVVARHRPRWLPALALTGSCLAALIIVVGLLAANSDSPLVGMADNILTSTSGILAPSEDDNAQFRFERWNYVMQLAREHPLVGAGYGSMLLPATYIGSDITGDFNADLPHNTFLTVLGKLGLIGLLPLLAICATVVVSLMLPHRPSRAEDAGIAVGASLLCMMVFGNFVLFFERPMHNAMFWISLACFCRLRELAAVSAARRAMFLARQQAPPALDEVQAAGEGGAALAA